MTTLDLSRATVVDFPLRGEWWALNTPAERVPSHGTDYFAQRYAMDFVRMEPTGTWFYPGGVRALLRHATTGLDAAAFHCWDQPILSATAGRVVAAGDGWPDRGRVHLLWDRVRAAPVSPDVDAGRDYRSLTGNYVMVEGGEGVALYGHLRCGSVGVRVGDHVAVGDLLGTVGNSGNSTMPHLHFQLMDGPDPLRAGGRLAAFRRYDRWQAGAGGSGGWVAVNPGVPGVLERIRR